MVFLRTKKPKTDKNGAPLKAEGKPPALGKDVTLTVFIPAFLASSVPGAAIGLLVLTTLRRLGLRKDSSR